MRKILACLLVVSLLMGVVLVSVAEEQEPEVFTSGEWEYIILGNGTVEIKYFTNIEAQEVTVPDKIDGRFVTSIADRAFTSYGRNVVSITIPDVVVNVEGNPFIGLLNLESIIVSDDNPGLAVIDGVLFRKKDRRLVCCPVALGKEEYAIPQGIQIIGANAFGLCSSIKSVTIPDSVIEIEDSAFVSCAGLTEILLPDSVITVGSNILGNCGQLKSIVVSSNHPALEVVDGVLFGKEDHRLICFPKGLEKNTYEIPEGVCIIGGCAFDFCTQLTDVKIPVSVKEIGSAAFIGCDGLEYVVIPESVTKIGNSAFAICNGLKSITIPASVEEIGQYALHANDEVVIIVDHDSVAEQYCQQNGLKYKYPDSDNWLSGD